jgi:hypothetical protein
MFDFFKFKKKHTYPTWADIPPVEYVQTDTPKYPNMTQPVSPKPKSKQTEFYRVGCTLDGMTSLTLLLEHNMSTTITLTKKDAEQMIRMIRATFTEESSTNE